MIVTAEVVEAAEKSCKQYLIFKIKNSAFSAGSWVTKNYDKNQDLRYNQL